LTKIFYLKTEVFGSYESDKVINKGWINEL